MPYRPALESVLAGVRVIAVVSIAGASFARGARRTVGTQVNAADLLLSTGVARVRSKA